MSEPLTDRERAILLQPCMCGHSINDHGTLSACWMCDEDEESYCAKPFETLLVERIGTIVAERAEADLADEKRRHEETLTRAALDIDKLLMRVAGFSEPWDRGYCQGVQDAAYAVRERRALLDTATEETSDRA